jgi:hypothetical protein
VWCVFMFMIHGYIVFHVWIILQSNLMHYNNINGIGSYSPVSFVLLHKVVSHRDFDAALCIHDIVLLIKIIMFTCVIQQ